MRGAVGPFLTTGVALATAGVVVANPIEAPSADVQIPAVALSAGSNDAVSMLDRDFLDAIETEPSRSTNPFTLLRDLISTLAADATHVGKNAIMEAFVAGVTAVSEPELTAVTVPLVPVTDNAAAAFPALDTPAAQVFLVPGLDMTAIEAALEVPTPDWQSLVPDSSAIVASIGPTVDYLVRSTISDVSYVGGELLAAAFAAGAAVAAEPVLIVKTVIALVNGDFQGALDNAVRAVVAPLEAPAIIVNAFQTVVERRIADLTGAPAPLRPVLSSGAEQADPAETPAESTDAPDSAETSPASELNVRLSGRSAQEAAAEPAVNAARPEAEESVVTVTPPASTPSDTAPAAAAAVTTAAGDSEESIGASQLRADASAAAAATSAATGPVEAPTASTGTDTADRASTTPRRGFGLTRGAAAAGAATSVPSAAGRAADSATSAATDGSDSGRS